MLILDDSGALVRIITSATCDVDAHVSFVDHTISGDVFLADCQNTNVTTATTTTICATPGAPPNRRNVKFINIRNAHASTVVTVTVEQTNGTTALELFKATLAAQEVLCMNDQGTWFVYDALGGVKVGASAASDTAAGVVLIATQAEMEAATSITAAVTPGRMHFHPGVAKMVAMTTGTATPALQTPPSYNITSITDNGVGDLTVTIATDFSSANWCCLCNCEPISVTFTAVANVMRANIRFGGIAAGTVRLTSLDWSPTTNVIRDPITWHVVGYGDFA